MGAGRLRLDQPLVLEIPTTAKTAAQAFVVEELARAGYSASETHSPKTVDLIARLSCAAGTTVALPSLRGEAGEEDYALRVFERRGRDRCPGGARLDPRGWQRWVNWFGQIAGMMKFRA